MAARCRICTTNDHEALAEELAETMWETRRDREIDPSWKNAAPYWQLAMRQFAQATLKMLHNE